MRRLVVTFPIAFLLVAPLASSATARERPLTLSAAPAAGLLDAPVSLRATGLGPRAAVQIRVTVRDPSGRPWRSQAGARADRRGSLALNGSLLLASLQPTGGSRRGTQPPSRPTSALDLRFEVRSDGRAVARASARRFLRDPRTDVRMLTLTADGLVGRYASMPSDQPRPAVLSLGGSEGGLASSELTTLLASRGYPTLELAYFRQPGLPQALREIPLEYLESGLRWLARQPGVDPERLVVLGRSRGAELALLLGSRYAELVYGVAAYAPSSVVNPALDGIAPAWTHAGRPIPHVTREEYGHAKPLLTPEAIIPVERIRGPIFVVAGVADGVWPAPSYAAAIADRLRAAGKRDFSSLIYPAAGHAVVATVPYVPSPTEVPGGTVADARARTDSWFKLLNFLARTRR